MWKKKRETVKTQKKSNQSCDNMQKRKLSSHDHKYPPAPITKGSPGKKAEVQDFSSNTAK